MPPVHLFKSPTSLIARYDEAATDQTLVHSVPILKGGSDYK